MDIRHQSARPETAATSSRNQQSTQGQPAPTTHARVSLLPTPAQPLLPIAVRSDCRVPEQKLYDGLNRTVCLLNASGAAPLFQGNFGSIFAVISNDPQVAGNFVVKTNRCRDDVHFALASREAVQHFSLNNPHILPCCGIAANVPTKSCYLLLPRMKESLQDRLNRYNAPRAFLPWPARQRICFEVASGIDYLHKNNLVHLDLYLRNIYLNQSDHAQIADLGSVQKHGTLNPHIGYTGDASAGAFREPMDIRHQGQAPEQYFGHFITKASDIFAWGGLALCLVNGNNRPLLWSIHPTCLMHLCFQNDCPHTGIPNRHIHLRSVLSIPGVASADMYLPAAEQARARELIPLLHICLQTDPTLRPSIQLILSELSRLPGQPHRAPFTPRSWRSAPRPR